MKALLPFIRLMRPHSNWVLGGVVFGLLTLLASIGLLTLSGWFISAAALAGVAAVTANAFNFFTPGAGVRGFAIARTVGRYAERVTTHEATFRILAAVRGWFYQRVERLGPARLQQYRSADLLNRLLADIDALDNLYLRVLAPSVIALMVSAALMFFLAWFSGPIALVTLLALLIAGIGVPWLAHRAGRRSGEAQLLATAQLRTRLVLLMQGLADLSIYGGVEQEAEKLRGEEADLQKTQMTMTLLSAVTSALITFIGGAAAIIVLALGIEAVHSQTIGPAHLAMLVFCVLAAFETVAPLPMAWQYLGKTVRAATRLQEVAASEPLVAYPQASAQASSPGEIRFDKVSFAYPGQGEAALTDFSLTVEPGEKVLVLGHTGSGKSTLIALLARFYDADQGVLVLGGKRVQDYSESVLRSQLSVLSQPVQLFSGSVRDNLRLAGQALDDNAMLAALNAVRLDQELGEAPLDYAIGESGSRLSGGQRKRLALARAMLRAAPVLLLDEPTEGLDQATEARVVKSLLQQSAGQTVLMISHHLQTAPLFDRVLILDRGRLVEQGAPDLLAQQAGSRYQELMVV